MITLVSSPKQHLPKHMQHSVCMHAQFSLKEVSICERVIMGFLHQDGITHCSLWWYTACSFYPSFVKLGPYLKSNSFWCINEEMKSVVEFWFASIPITNNLRIPGLLPSSHTVLINWFLDENLFCKILMLFMVSIQEYVM